MNCKLSVLIAVLFVSVAHSWTTSCTYYAEDYSSSITIPSTWINLTDTKQNTWFINPCPLDFDIYNSPCPSNSGVCVRFHGADELTSVGSTKDCLFSYLPNGIEYDFAVDTPCLTPKIMEAMEQQTMKTSVIFNCDPNSYLPFYFAQTDGCYTLITVNSSDYCVEGNNVQLDGDMPPLVEEHRVIHISIPFLFLLSIGLLLSVCMCCCCAIRRRRCQIRKQQAMSHISNIAFQPIPNSQMNRYPGPQVAPSSTPQQPQGSVQIPLPAYNPYMIQPQQQFVYYYPSQQAPATQQQHQQVQLDDADEKMAMELQSQFDREARM